MLGHGDHIGPTVPSDIRTCPQCSALVCERDSVCECAWGYGTNRLVTIYAYTCPLRCCRLLFLHTTTAIYSHKLLPSLDLQRMATFNP